MDNGLTRAHVKELSDQYGVTPSRALGQNFIVDANIVAKIADAITTPTNVIEIGPGLGSLTIFLARTCEHVYAIEYDAHIIEPLRDVLARFELADNVTIDHKDVMDVDLQLMCTEKNIQTIVGNLPYNISATLIVDIARKVPACTQLVVMVQKEVADRLCAPLKSRNVSSATLKAQFFMEAQTLFDVGHQAFVPKPRVDSTVMTMTRRVTPLVDIGDADIDTYFSLIETAFSQRRKMLRRSLAGLFGERANNIFQASAVDPTLRPEQCDHGDFHSLFVAWESGV
jgi:16S rRNA (adenine1518-N6/adenine1519-N6)-dimethyltransferase